MKSRWCTKLEQFEFTIKDKADQDNTVADELYRLPQAVEEEDSEEEYVAMRLIQESELAGGVWSPEKLHEKQVEVGYFEAICRPTGGGGSPEELQKNKCHTSYYSRTAFCGIRAM